VSPLLLVGIGLVGGVGAIGRLLLDGAVAARLARAFPYGTLTVNLTGTLALGVLVGAAVRGDALSLVGTGFLGAYTTFSTWTLESHRLAEDGEMRVSLLNLTLSLTLGLAFAWLGRTIGTAL
jgi:CrcB protein